MKNLTVRVISALLAFVLLAAIACQPVAGEEGADQNLKIAVLSGISSASSAPYDADALAKLFAASGHEANVITSEQLACYDDFNASLYDLVMLPTGAAFPYIAAANFKRFFAEGGRIITSGGYAFSETLYPQAEELVAGSGACLSSTSKSASPCIYKRIPASMFTQGVKYTVSVDIKTQDVSTESGLAHGSLYIYAEGEKLLSWMDFFKATSGSTDWAKQTYTFTVPANAQWVDIRLGMYITSGTVSYDNVKLTAADGKEIFSDDFEDGTLGKWLKTLTGSNMTYSVGEGMPGGGDTATSIYSGSSADAGTYSYDLTEALSGASSAEFSFNSSNTQMTGGSASAYVLLKKDGIETARYDLSKETSEFGWHGRRQTVELSADHDEVSLVFEASGSGTLIVDDISVKAGGKTVYTQNSGAAKGTVSGGITVTSVQKETGKAGLCSSEPISVGDLLFYSEDQMPIFDAETYFSDAVKITAAEGQAVYPDGVYLEDTAISGYSAITVTGNYRGRWQPLLWAYDNFGKKTGAVAAIFRLYSQPTTEGKLSSIKTWEAYTANSIGFFGIDDRDLFAEGNDGLRAGLVRMAELMCGGGYICCAENAYDCYRDGESPAVTAYVENSVKGDGVFEMKCDIVAEDSGEVVYTQTETAKTYGKARRFVTFKWNEPSFADDFYYVNLTLMKDGEIIDRYTSGFVVWKDEVAKSGPEYTYHDNYIYVKQADGSEKAVFATGADDGGNLFLNEDQTPLAWKTDFAARADNGVYIYECLQQYRGYGDFSSIFATNSSFEKHMRNVDCVVYLSQRYGQIYMMGMLLGANSAVDDEQLEADAVFISKMAERYKDVPGVIYYLNGDLIVKPEDKMNTQFREFIKERYGSDEAFNKAWGVTTPIDSLTFDSSYSFNGKGWSDVKAYDQNLFRTQMIKRWSSRLVKAVRDVAGDTKAVLCEYYSWPMDGTDVPYSIGDLTYSNSGYFDTPGAFVSTIAYADQRWQGKSFGIGETNKRTHPAFAETLDYYSSGSYAYARGFFFTTCLSTYAMGGNHYQVWSWKDETKYTFPWGLTYIDGTERDSNYWLRNINLALSEAEPVYKTPEVAFITPDSTRMSGSKGWYLGHYDAIKGINILQGTLAESILTLNECDFEIPDGVKVVFYPLAYTMPDDVYEKLLAFAQKGGTVYISGDPSYNTLTRVRDSEAHLTALAGVVAEKVNYAGIDVSGTAVTYSKGSDERTGTPNIVIKLSGAEALYTAADGSPVITVNSVGSGKVVYSADPFEMNSDSSTFISDTGIYSYVLGLAGIKTADITASTKSVRSFVLPLADGGSFREVLNTSAADVKAELKTASGEYKYRLSMYDATYFREDADGSLISLMLQGSATRNGQKFLNNECFAQILSLDGKDVSSSSMLAVLPQSEGEFSLTGSFSGLTAFYGQVSGGKFVTGGEIALTDGSVSFKAEGDIVNSIVLVCRAENADEAKAKALSLLRANSSSGEAESSEPETSGGENPSGNGWLLYAGIAVAAIAAAGALILLFSRKRKK